MYLKHKSSYFVTTKMNRFLITLLLFLGTSFVYAQKVYIPKTTPFKDKSKGVNVDSVQRDTIAKVRNTEVNYDVSDLFNLDLSESERAQAKAIIEVFSEQIDEDSSNLGAYINRGSYWATLGLHVQAIKDYDKAIDINDQQPIIYYNRALSKARFFYTFDACLDLKQARDLGLQQANTLMVQQCGKHMAKLNAYLPDTVSK
jgi:tetratricopeptide (TPR) repeat protein